MRTTEFTREERLEAANRYYWYLLTSFDVDRHSTLRMKRIGLYEKLIARLKSGVDQ